MKFESVSCWSKETLKILQAKGYRVYAMNRFPGNKLQYHLCRAK